MFDAQKLAPFVVEAIDDLIFDNSDLADWK
jgi:hypothetical protein